MGRCSGSGGWMWLGCGPHKFGNYGELLVWGGLGLLSFSELRLLFGELAELGRKERVGCVGLIEVGFRQDLVLPGCEFEKMLKQIPVRPRPKNRRVEAFSRCGVTA